MENGKDEPPPEPSAELSLLDVLASLDDLDEAFSEIEALQPEPVDLFDQKSPPAAPARRR